MYRLKCWKIILAISVLSVIVTSEDKTQIANAETRRVEGSNMLKRNGAEGEGQRTPGLQYDAQGRRDPFLPLVPTERKANPNKFPDPLSLSQQQRFQVRGIVSGGEGYHAIIQGSDGKRYFVETGSILPTEGLKVKVITDTQLVLERFGGNGEQHDPRVSEEWVLSFRD